MLLDELLRARRDDIVRDFVRRARATVPADSGQSETGIVDHVPQLIDELADAVETGRTSLPPARATARNHAKTRWDQGMDARTLVREYALLRSCVLDVANGPSSVDLATIERFFDGSIGDAVSEYVAITEQQAARLRGRLEEENRRLERLHGSLALLSEAGAVLAAASADQRQALQGLAAICVPRLADCCSVYLCDGRRPSPPTIVHVVPEKAALVRELYERFPLGADALHGLPAVLRSGRSELVSDVDQDLYERTAENAEHLGLLRAVGAVSWMVVPLSVPGRSPIAAMALASAESGRHFTEEDLALAEELGRRAALVLDHAHLFEAARRERARAEEATRAKDEFLAIVSHELRTPLNAILGWSRILRGTTLAPAKIARGLEVIERNAAVQAQLIGDLLDVSRIVTGHLRLEIGSVELGYIVEMAVEAVRPAANAKGIRLEARIHDRAGVLRGDPVRLQQVVWNLLTNAVKFTPKNGRVSVDLDRVGSDVELTVADNGVGIEPAELPFIFERFRQEDASVVRAFGGLGLGLAIARHLVELHGGAITASSPGKNQGTTFVVRLPLSAVTTTDTTRLAMAPEDHAAPPTEMAKVAGMRVLVVEDETDARELLALMLGECGVEVQTASSVSDALEAFDRFRPDVILSDIGMPVEDGYSLARRIRALPDEAGGNTPMIALTAYARDEDRTRARVEGFSAHISKPVEPSELLDRLSSLRFPRR